MSHIKLVIVVFGLILFQSFPSFGTFSRSTDVYAYALDYRLTEAGMGHYDRLLAYLQEGLGLDVSVQPLIRSHQSFQGSRKACLFPSAIAPLVRMYPGMKRFPLVAGNNIDYVSLRVFSHPDKRKINEVGELKGLKLAFWNGLSPDQLLEGVAVTLEPTSGESVRVKMLDAGRIDAILGFMPDVYLAAEQLGLRKPKYNENLSILKNGVTLVCHDNPENRALIAEFNRLLRHLKRSGRLRGMLGPYAEIAAIND